MDVILWHEGRRDVVGPAIRLAVAAVVKFAADLEVADRGEAGRGYVDGEVDEGLDGVEVEDVSAVEVGNRFAVDLVAGAEEGEV